MERAKPESLAAPLNLLYESLRDGEPASPEFAENLSEVVRSGEIELLAAYSEESVVGVLVLAYRLNVAAGGRFASVEELHVRPEARRRGVGRALLDAAARDCRTRGVSYVEVQAEGEATGFYSALGYEREEELEVLSRSYPL